MAKRCAAPKHAPPSCACAITPWGRAANRACPPTPRDRRAAGSRRQFRKAEAQGAAAQAVARGWPGVCQAIMAHQHVFAQRVEEGRARLLLDLPPAGREPAARVGLVADEEAVDGLARERADGLLVARAVDQHVEVELRAQRVRCTRLSASSRPSTSTSADRHRRARSGASSALSTPEKLSPQGLGRLLAAAFRPLSRLRRKVASATTSRTWFCGRGMGAGLSKLPAHNSRMELRRHALALLQMSDPVAKGQRCARCLRRRRLDDRLRGHAGRTAVPARPP